jgi:nucleoside-diphosphate-sugar epimerase
METRDYKRYLSVFLWLVGLHSLSVGIGLLTIPPSFFIQLGLLENKENFFQDQGGTFHVAMSLAYCMAALNAGKSRQLIRFIIYVKLLAFVFLISYFLFVLPNWVILFSGVTDGIMGSIVLYLSALSKKTSNIVVVNFRPDRKPLSKHSLAQTDLSEEKSLLTAEDTQQTFRKESAAHGLPVLILTGASGLIGKYLLEELKNDYRIFAIARRSQHECGAPRHSNIAWLRADISNLNSITKAFREIKTAGGADFLIHLAAYYDYVNEFSPDYKLTNIGGTRNVLDLTKAFNLKCFFFASSVAACSFPPVTSDNDGTYIDEDSPPDGSHIYAQTKKAGEDMVKEFSKHTPAIIFRLGAVFSDWCEYPPLYNFLTTWLGDSWKAKILAGKGKSAIPYIHIRDVILFFKQFLKNYKELKPGEVLIASTNGSTTHHQLYTLATRHYFGKENNPILLPKFICAIGIYITSFFKRILQKEIFEQPWMIKYIDKQLNVRSKRTSTLLNWKPNPQLFIEKRFPFLVERMKSEPLTWQMRNIMILRKTAVRIDFHIYSALVEIEDSIIENLFETIDKSEEAKFYKHLQSIEHSEIEWFIKLIYRLLLTSIDTNNKLIIQNYFEVSGINRFQTGYKLEEMIFLLKKINDEIIEQLRQTDYLKKFEREFFSYITLPIEFGIDEAERQYNSFIQRSSTDFTNEKERMMEEQRSAREKLEETIWDCLVHRK